MRGRALLAD
jgi:hypothetical protein